MVAILLLGVVYAALQIHQSLDQGKLGHPATYDDSMYFVDGLERVHALYDYGPLQLLEGWWKSPPHSPWSTLVAVSGFALLGVQAWAPSVAASVVLIVALAVLVIVTRHLSISHAVLIAIAGLTWPIVSYLVIDIRPDMVWGLSVAAFCATVSGGATRALTRPVAFWAGALLAFALLAKTSTFPVTLAVAGAVCCATLVARLRSDPASSRAHLRILLLVAIVAAALTAPHYLTAGRRILLYIYQNMFGDYAHIWRLPLDARGHLLYHLTGWGGATMMGAWLWLTIATFALFVLAIVRRGDRDMAWGSACYGVGVVVAFMAVTLPAHKSHFLGAIFPAMLLLGWISMTIYLVDTLEGVRRGRMWSLVLLVLLAGAGVATFRSNSTIEFGVPDADRFADMRQRHADIQSIFAALERNDITSGRVFFAASATYLNATTLRYYALARRLDGMEFHDEVLLADSGSALARASQSSAVLVFTADFDEVGRQLPSSNPTRLTEILKAVESDQQFRLATTIRAHRGTGEARLYLRRSQFQITERAEGLRRPRFQITERAEGFGAQEGPYPRQSLPAVRWGLGPVSRFVIPASEHPTQLVLEAQTPHAGEVLTIRVNGLERLQYAFTATNSPEVIAVPLSPPTGDEWKVEFEYSKWNLRTEVDQRKFAVLFRRIQWW